MKTPREILLARHKAAEPRLDEIRRAIVTQFTAKTQSSQGAKIDAAQVGQPFNVFASFRLGVEKLWRELFWSSRRVWGGLAPVWLVMLVVNRAIQDGGSSAQARAEPPSPEILQAIQAQRRLMAELNGEVTEREAVPGSGRPRPQSRRETKTTLA